MSVENAAEGADLSVEQSRADGPQAAVVGVCPHSDRPPMPPARAGKVSIWRYFKMFRRDILSAQPAHLFRAWMAEFRTPFFRSYLCNDPELVDQVLKAPIRVFPKSERIRVGLKPLLGESIFISNGDLWEHQRRIIDPAFDGGRLRTVFPAMWDSGIAAVGRLMPLATGAPVEIEAQTSRVALDVIVRTLFSVPVEQPIAAAAFAEFRAHQSAQPVANIAAILPWPRWMPRFHSRRTRRTAARIRGLIAMLVDNRAREIAESRAPDDLATKIMTTPDPETGAVFERDEMIDQVAIFFLAGHETSAAALAWALYLLARYPDWQERLAEEARVALDPGKIYFSALSKLRLSRAVFRESMRLYPPVPMMVRETTCPQNFRDRDIPTGSQIVLSAWHLHRHERIWDNPHGFDPGRWDTPNGREGLRHAYIPFSAGTRTCPGSAFAMAEGPLILSLLVRAFRFDLVPGREPVPEAHLTLRARDGIHLTLTPRAASPVPTLEKDAGERSMTDAANPIPQIDSAAAPHPAPLRAWPYWLSITFVPLVALALIKGGWTIALIPLYGWALMPLIDIFVGKNMGNADITTPDTKLLWFRLLTWIWFPIEFCLVFGAIWAITRIGGYSTIEMLALMFGIGVTTGTVGIVYAHELFHKPSFAERNLGDLLLAMVLYGHFRTEHLLVHHAWVGTRRDTVTARYNEGFLRFFPRVLLQGPHSAWRAERAKLARAGRGPLHPSNPIWKYLFLNVALLGIAYGVGGWLGIGLFAFQAIVAVWQLELTNYVEHYGLTRRHLGEGRYEPVQLHHSWDSAHRVSGLLLLNLQRHADHHIHPMRRYPLLQIYGPDKVPQLPTGYPPLTALAMVPPLWRRLFNPRVRAWRRHYYPDIQDWSDYKTLSHPMPHGAG